MTIEKNLNGTELTINIAGRLDTATAPQLEGELSASYAGIEKLILNFADLEYISSAGLRQIVAAYKMMHGNMTLRNVPGEIMDIIRMTGVDKRMKFE